MPLIKFVGGPHDGDTRDIPQATGGATVSFTRESGTAEYEFTGSYVPGTGARVYRIKDAAPVRRQAAEGEDLKAALQS